MFKYEIAVQCLADTQGENIYVVCSACDSILNQPELMFLSLDDVLTKINAT